MNIFDLTLNNFVQCVEDIRVLDKTGTVTFKNDKDKECIITYAKYMNYEIKEWTHYSPLGPVFHWTQINKSKKF